MGGHDDAVLKEGVYRSGGQAMKHALYEVAVAPILLPLSADAFVPWLAQEFPAKIFKNDVDRRQETSPEAYGTAGVYGPAIRTPPAFDPRLSRDTVEISGHEAVAPEAGAAAAGTTRGAGPGKPLALHLNF